MSDTPGTAVPTMTARRRRPPRGPPRPPQRGHRRPRRPRQDHPRGRDAPPDRRLPRQPGRRGPGDGLGRPRAREGHHDPRQADDDRRRRRAAEHRRHPRPRRLRRRGRAQPAHGRQRPAAGRRGGGAAARRPGTCSRRRWRAACRWSSPSTRSTARTPGRPRSSTPSTSCSWTSAPTSTRSSSRSSTRTPSSGTATRDLAVPGTDLGPLLELLVDVTPAPEFEPGHPLQLLVTNLSANEYVGRMAVGRIRNGTIRVGQRITVVREEADDTAGAIEPGRTVTLTGTVSSLQTAHGMERIDIAEAGPGEIVSVAGLPEVTIGDTLTDPQDPRPLPRLDVDAPTLSDDVRREHLAARRPRRQVRHVAPDQGPPRARGPGQRLDRGLPDRVGRHLRGPRPRRAPARRAHRADAPRGLRADRQPPGGHPPRRSAARSRSRTSGSRSTSRPTTSAWSSRRWPAARAASSR